MITESCVVDPVFTRTSLIFFVFLSIILTVEIPFDCFTADIGTLIFDACEIVIFITIASL